MTDSPTLLVVGLAAAGLLPFALVMVTSFVKMAVVLSIVRSALGAPQIPPNAVVTGLALVLSLVVMAPVASRVAAVVERDSAVWEQGRPSDWLAAVERAAVPVRDFLERQTRPDHYDRFAALGDAGRAGGDPPAAGPVWRALLPAFVVSQLHEAFLMGFTVFLPFLVVDMLVASVLLSLGMHMLSPTTISLPFKLLLFALVDGWSLIGESLLGGFGR
jgi:type III secretion protein R